jgi:hypothetical protein
MRFLDLELEEAVPMATTIWLFREALAKAGLIDQLFARFGQHLEAGGYIALCVRRQCGAARKRNQGEPVDPAIRTMTGTWSAEGIMASGPVCRTNRPNTWLHRPATQREDSPCQL